MSFPFLLLFIYILLPNISLEDKSLNPLSEKQPA